MGFAEKLRHDIADDLQAAVEGGQDGGDGNRISHYVVAGLDLLNLESQMNGDGMTDWLFDQLKTRFVSDVGEFADLCIGNMVTDDRLYAFDETWK